MSAGFWLSYEGREIRVSIRKAWSADVVFSLLMDRTAPEDMTEEERAQMTAYRAALAKINR